jgi:hypothetical protein
VLHDGAVAAVAGLEVNVGRLCTGCPGGHVGSASSGIRLARPVGKRRQHRSGPGLPRKPGLSFEAVLFAAVLFEAFPAV